MTDELRQLLAKFSEENRRHFDSVAERLDAKMEQVTEGLTLVDQKLDRTATDIRAGIRTGFAETQAMLKFSHADLDRRIGNLEHKVENLEERLGRLESSDPT